MQKIIGCAISRISILIGVLVSILISMPMSCLSVTAAEAGDMSFSFDLTVDGKDTKEVETGDIITVVLKLRRTDAKGAYTMYAMQDEIRYDSTFLELVEGGMVLGNGIVSTDIAMVDHYREFYMNYLSMSGGEKWDADMLIGSVQFKVIGKSGVTRITSQDYLVSMQDGSESYPCDANDITIILSTNCTVSFETNGGSEIPDQTIQYGEKVIRPEDPVREGYRFEGWYTDIHLTDEWDFEENVVEGNLSIYAKWVEDATSSVNVDEGLGSGSCMWWIVILIIMIIVFLLLFKRKKKDEERIKR